MCIWHSRRGARGYLLKDTPRVQLLLDAIRRAGALTAKNRAFRRALDKKLVENMSRPCIERA